MAAIFEMNFRTQTFWDGSKQPNILQGMARAHSSEARGLGQGFQEETWNEGLGVRSEKESVCGQAGDNRS